MLLLLNVTTFYLLKYFSQVKTPS